VTATDLATHSLAQARLRVQVLPRYLELGGNNIVIREAQEAVELALKALLRKTGIEPPKWHDVGPILRDQCHLLPPAIHPRLDRLIAISHQLRKERELSFYGDIDFLPPDNYSPAQAQEAIENARFVLETAELAFPPA
jgi:HEPN domain-containing protein